MDTPLCHRSLVPEATQDFSPAFERIAITRTLAWKLRVVRFSILPLPEDLRHVVRVRRVFPCRECTAPVAVIKFGDQPGVRIVDAVPTSRKRWTADVLIQHDCDVYPIHDCGGDLHRVLMTTWLLGTHPRLNQIFLPVKRASACPRCGQLIAAVKIGWARPEWFAAALDWWGERFTANLARPHDCPEPSRGVRQ